MQTKEIREESKALFPTRARSEKAKASEKPGRKKRRPFFGTSREYNESIGAGESIRRRKEKAMIYTSAEANKLLKKLGDDHASLLAKEEKSRVYNAALGEDPDEVRPTYDYAATQTALSETEKKIIALKHAISVFNTTHKVPGFDLTIDEMLVYIPMLTKKKAKLAEMKSRLPRERVTDSFGRNTTIIDYTFINYDLEKVEKDYETVSEELSRAQTALDSVNSTETFEFSF